MKPLLSEKYHYWIYVCSLISLVIALPLSKFLMSLSLIVLACNWVLEGNLKNKFIHFRKNKPALVLSSLLLLHVIGLAYTSDFSYAFKDIRIKLPLFILPLILSTSPPLSKKLFDRILQFFVAAILLGTIISTLILLGVIHRPILDVRGISIFISHIRFALLICVALFVSAYFIYNASLLKSKIIWTILITWFLLFLILMESLTGLAILFITSLILLMYAILKIKNQVIRYSGFVLVSGSTVLTFFYFYSIVNENTKIENIDFGTQNAYTSWDNIYGNDSVIKRIWEERSKMKLDGKDLKGNDIRFTLIRFLASKGLRKDSTALHSITNQEIIAIERGVTDVNYQSISSLKGRIRATLWEIELYKTTGDANGHSLTQRFEYWKSALDIIKGNLFFGVGTGDIQTAFDEQYIKMKSSLKKEWRLRSHNQYLSIGVAFGAVGLLWFLITLFYPLIKQKMAFNYLYITFFILVTISFLTEDTLETQAGVTFYAFFNSFFLFLQPVIGNNENK